MYGSCRSDSEAEKPRIEELNFPEPKIDMKIGERQAVKINVKPSEARKHYTVEYTASVDGYVTISETSNDGCVLTAEQGGTIILIAKAGGFTAYLEVNIAQDEYVQMPYIQIANPVVELSVGSKKSIQLNLFNGSAVDQQNFEYSIESGKDCIAIFPTGNTLVISGQKPGVQKIECSHPKSEYTATILCFVTGISETLRYITCTSNVILMYANGASKMVDFQLVNSAPTDLANFTFEILEPNPPIQILSSNNSVNITAQRAGTALIRAHHPLAVYDGQEIPLDIRVIVVNAEESWITNDWSVKFIDLNTFATLTSSLAGSYEEVWYNDFHFSKVPEDNPCIELTQTGFSAFINALAPGSCIIRVTNDHIQYASESLIIVKDPQVVAPDECYITTSQNVIQLELGQTFPTQLNCQLINGNEGDKADFEWVVEDGRIIEISTLDLPEGKGPTYITRSMKNRKKTRAMTEIKSVANTLALIEPLKIGQTRITISHPKSIASAQVIIKVYPRGTFSNAAYILNNPEGGLIKVDTTVNNGVKPVHLEMLSGDPLTVGALDWSILNNNPIATLIPSYSLENEITGHQEHAPGVTKLLVNNEKLRNPLENTVLVGTTTQLQQMAVLYVDQVYQNVSIGQSVNVAIFNSQQIQNNAGILQPNNLTNSDSYYLEPYDTSKFNAVMIKNRLLIQGIAETNGNYLDLTIGNTSGIITPTTIKVRVLGDVTIDKPYSLTGPNFVGLLPGTTKAINVTLTDAPDIEQQQINWRSAHPAIVAVTGNGPQAMMTGGNSTAQTNIVVSHTKSINEKIIIAYVDPKGREPEELILIGIAKETWLLQQGSETMMQLITNAGERVGDLVWDVDNDAITVNPNGDKALIKAVHQGSATITVWCKNKNNPTNNDPAQGDQLIPLKIYVSVSDMPVLEKNITLPSILEIIIGENKILTAITQGLSAAELAKISWTLEDSSVVAVSGESSSLTGGKLFITGKERGQTWLTARQNDMGYMKKILVVCARTYEELASTYVIAAEESYYRIKVGDTKTIRLMFGSAGFPSGDIPFIRWSDDGNKVVKIHDGGGGDSAQIEALNLGITTITVNHRDDSGNCIILKPVSITIETFKDNFSDTHVFKPSVLIMGLVTSLQAETATAKHEKTLTVAIDPSGPSWGLFTFYDEQFPDDSVKPESDTSRVHPAAVFDCVRGGNEFIITGKNPGQSYLRISHPQVAEDVRILIYAAATEAELNEMFPVGLSTTHYLLTQGSESQHVILTVPPDTVPGFADKIKKITWGQENVAVFSSNIPSKDINNPLQNAPVIPGTATNLYTYTLREIKGLTAGNGALNIRYNNVTVDKAYISVKTQNPLDFSRRIVTESIIGMTVGETDRITSVGTNLTPDEYNGIGDNAGLVWRSMNPAIVAVTPVTGNRLQQKLTAKAAGETEIVVNYGPIERFIKVYVTNNTGQKDNYKAINLDNRYYQIRKNDELTLQAFHAAMPCAPHDSWDFYSNFDSNIVSLEPAGKDKVTIKGINEGIACIVLSNTDTTDYGAGAKPVTPVNFMVEVNNTAPLVENNPLDAYLTAVKTVYALDETKTMDVLRLTVNAVRLTDQQIPAIQWKVVSEKIGGVTKVLSKTDTPQLLDLYGNKTGSFLDISTKNKKGEAVIRVSHELCLNTIDFTILCDKQAAAESPFPYIVSSKEVVKVKLYETETVTLSIENILKSYNIESFNAVCDSDKIEISKSGTQLSFKGKKFGQCLVTVTHPDSSIAKKIIVMVMADNISLVYLTTRQNFVLCERNNFVALEAAMVGFDDINNANWHWSTDDTALISISPSGKKAVVSSKNVLGTARVTVSNDLCPEFPVSMYVRIADSMTQKPTYITTDNNIMVIKEGASMQFKAKLVNGAESELSQMRWRTYDTHLIELNSSGDTAMIKGLKPGTAGVTISHDSSLNSITVLVIVEPETPNSGIYIAADSLLVEMGVNESQRLIKARLIGGKPEDIYGFQWEITNYNSLIKQQPSGRSNNVITITAAADMCYINPFKSGNQTYEGEAIITISHPLTSYHLDIKVILRDNTPIQFAQAYATVKEKDQLIINVSGPKTGNLIYQSSNNAVAKAAGTNDTCVIDTLQPGTVTVTVRNESGSQSDSIIVTVQQIEVDGYYLDVEINGSNSSIVSLMAGSGLASSVATVRGYVRNLRTGEEVLGTKGYIRYKLVDSASSNLVEIKNATLGSNGWYTNTEGMINIEAKQSTGNAVLLFEYAGTSPAPDPGNIKGEQKKVYIQIRQADFAWIISTTYVTLIENGAAEQVWAKIENTSDFNPGKPPASGDTSNYIVWSSQKTNIAEVSCEGSSSDHGSIALITPKGEGTCQIYMEYKGSTRQITVIVQPQVWIIASPSTVHVQPDSEYVFKVTSHPNTENIVVTIDSNIGVELFGRQGTTDIPTPTKDQFTNDIASSFICGPYGYFVKVKGTNTTGIVNITFNMINKGKKMVVTCSNIKNDYVRWKTDAFAKFQPNATSPQKYYYITSLENDYLEVSPGQSFDGFTVETIKDGKPLNDNDGKGKYIQLKKTGSQYKTAFNSQGISFMSKMHPIFIPLPYYIYYEGLADKLYWEKQYAGARSSFDAANYAITVAPRETVAVDLKLPSTYPSITDCKITITAVSPNTTTLFNAISYNNCFTVTNNSQDPPFNTKVDVQYAGTVIVTYKVYIGAPFQTEFTRNFLIYVSTYK